ncbi:unnamed protein product, partial [Allacma fusca]
GNSGGTGGPGGAGGEGDSGGNKKPWWKTTNVQTSVKVNTTAWWDMIKEQAAKKCPPGKKCKVKVKKPISINPGSGRFGDSVTSNSGAGASPGKNGAGKEGGAPGKTGGGNGQPAGGKGQPGAGSGQPGASKGQPGGGSGQPGGGNGQYGGGNGQYGGGNGQYGGGNGQYVSGASGGGQFIGGAGGGAYGGVGGVGWGAGVVAPKPIGGVVVGGYPQASGGYYNSAGYYVQSGSYYVQGSYYNPSYAAVACSVTVVGSVCTTGRVTTGTGWGRSIESGKDSLNIVDYITHPGWKPIFDNVTTEITLQTEDVPYVGFGFCKYQHQSIKDLESASSGSEATKFFLNALRIGCLRQEISSLSSLYDQECLSLRDDNSLEVHPGCKFLKKEKLTLFENYEFSRAFELAAFSQEYVAELKNPTKSVVTPDGEQISRATYLLGKIAFHVISESRLRARHHIVKLTRNLIKSLKTAFTKSIHDLNEINNRCGKKCKLDLEVNEHDRLYLLTLIEFVIRGVGTKTSQEDAEELFKAFYGKNKDLIKGRLNDYFQ